MIRRVVAKKIRIICSSFHTSTCRYAEEATFTVKEFETFRLSSEISNKANLTKADGLRMLETMWSIRRIETTCAQLYQQKAIRGFCHLYNGQEAVAVGLHETIVPADYLITAYRCHAFPYLFGEDLTRFLQELLGQKEGMMRAKGGSMHLYKPPQFFGGNGIVGSQVPLGAGLGFCLKYKNQNGISYTLYGDGAANQGQVFEAFNISKLWNLPIIFVCENNGYGMGTSTSRSSANALYYTRGDYIPGILVDGMDVLAVREAARFSRDYVKTNGPIILEMLTYRYFGHSMSDPGYSYRTREEIKTVRDHHDPILKLKGRLVEGKLATEEEIKAIETQTKAKVERIRDEALKGKEPDLSEISADVYVSYHSKSIRGVSPWDQLKHISLGAPKKTTSGKGGKGGFEATDHTSVVLPKLPVPPRAVKTEEHYPTPFIKGKSLKEAIEYINMKNSQTDSQPEKR